MSLSAYQFFLGLVLVLWPVTIVAALYFMSKLEDYVKRLDADTPEEAGLEPVAGRTTDREVKIVYEGKVVGE
jgi:hypothetical protein